MVRFIRKFGRIIPIRVPDVAKDMGVGFGVVMGSTLLANKARKKLSEKIQGKGKKSFGGLSNTVFEIGASAAAITALHRFGPKRVRTGIRTVGNIFSNSFGLARKQGRGI